MKRKAIHRPILEVSSDSSITPAGHTTEVSAEDATTFEAVSERATQLRQLYSAHSLNLFRSPTLLALLTGAETLAASPIEARTFDGLLSALQTQRLAEAILPLARNSQARGKLAETLDGGINLLHRGQSKAKDTLWELELHRILSSFKIDTQFAEPDLIVALAGSNIGVACKKLYSEANVEKVLSQVVGQIERNCTSGIVALDIENLLPANAVLRVPNTNGMAVWLNGHNDSFMKRHERHIRKYLEPGRAISVVVSCAAIVDILDRTPRFYTARQTTMWNIPNHSPSLTAQVDAMLQALLSAHV